MLPDLPLAARWFILFRVGFSVRFYYPVFSLLFLDLGLSLEQFALLNAVWAVTIVIAEVPSGALADVLGRRLLVRAAACLMAFEMMLLLVAPFVGGAWLMTLLVANRIASGLAEASASGADEALAYDALAEAGQRNLWPRVLERLAKLQAWAFGIAMLSGGLLYDASMLTRILQWTGLDVEVGSTVAHRLPVLATLGMAGIAIVAAFAMRESAHHEAANGSRPRLADAWRNTLASARWLLSTPAARILILAALVGDVVVRLILTLKANILVILGFTPAVFGLIGAMQALLGSPSAGIARRMVERHDARTNFAAAAAVIFLGLLMLAPAIPGFSVLAIVPLMMGFAWIGFFLSHELNALVEPARRATVLSCKGLAFNVGYGLATAAYGAAVAPLTRSGHSADEALALSLPALPTFFLILAGIVALLWRPAPSPA